MPDLSSYLAGIADEYQQAEKELIKYHEYLAAAVQAHSQELIAVNEQLRQEIEERKRVEQSLINSESALLENKHFLQDIFDGIQDHLSFVDTEYTILHANKSVLNVYSPSIIGEKCYAAYHGRAVPCENCPVERAIAAKELQMEVKEAADASGNRRWFEVYAYPVLDDRQEVKWVVEHGRDITARRKMDQEMARLEQMHLVGEMAAGLGHEIRNPLTTIRGFSQLLKGKSTSAQDRDYYDLMIDELDRVNSIITEYLNLAKDKKAARQQNNLNAIIRSMLPLIQADASKSDKIIRAELNDIPDLLLDAKEIRQVILNLVHNGLEAMPGGGALTIETYPEDGEAVMAVRDQGTGINKDVIEKIGIPFFTTKEKGTGLGLAICYSIANRHHAALKFDTGPRGTTFFMRFKPE